MEFTVELRYHGGSSTVLSVEAETADQALYDVCDKRRRLVGINIAAPGAAAAGPGARSTRERPMGQGSPRRA